MNSRIDKKEKNRIIEIDIIRGIAVLFMIFDHFIFDLWGVLPVVFKDYPRSDFSIKLYNFAVDYWLWDFREAFRYVVVFLFLGIVGVCASFSKNNINRGKKLLMVALFLTIGTLIFSIISGSYSNIILFGTLHCIALSLVFVGLLEKVVKKDYVYLLLGTIMLLVGIYFEFIYEVVQISSSSSLFDVIRIVLGQFIGIYECGGDTMPILLNGGQVFIGVYIGKTLYKKRESLFKKKYSNNVITFIGRNSLVIYFLHQVLIPILLIIIFMILGFTLV